MLVHSTSTVENPSVCHSHSCDRDKKGAPHPLSIVSGCGNSLCGGACRLDIISIPNDDVLEGDFEFSSGNDFQ